MDLASNKSLFYLYTNFIKNLFCIGLDYNGSMDSAAVDGDVEDAVEEDEGWDMITCFCGKPFAGRPMIECSGNRIGKIKFHKYYSVCELSIL